MLPAHFIPGGRPLIWAHRGASAEAPENTLAAFALALAQGADGIELDAQRCATGEVVVIHDDSLARTTGLAALVVDTTWPVLRTLDASAWKGSGFRGEQPFELFCVFGSLRSSACHCHGKAAAVDIVEINVQYFETAAIGHPLDLPE